MKDNLTIGFAILIIILALFVFAACGPQHYHYVKVGKVTGDVWARNIGSRSQMIGGVNDLGIGIPIEGVPLRIDSKGEAPMQGTVLIIGEVNGCLYFEEAYVGTQNIPIPESIEALYKYGDPFEIK